MNNSGAFDELTATAMPTAWVVVFCQVMLLVPLSVFV
jgi:hypothetical protein